MSTTPVGVAVSSCARRCLSGRSTCVSSPLPLRVPPYKSRALDLPSSPIVLQVQSSHTVQDLFTVLLLGGAGAAVLPGTAAAANALPSTRPCFLTTRPRAVSGGRLCLQNAAAPRSSKSESYNTAAEATGDAIDRVKGVAGEVADKAAELKGSVTEAAEGAIGSAGEANDKAVEDAKSTSERVLEKTEEEASKAVKATEGAWGAAKDAAQGVADKVADAAKAE